MCNYDVTDCSTSQITEHNR